MTTEAAKYQKISLTVPSDVVARVRERVERGQLSAYFADAVRRQLERDNLIELVGELVDAHGPLDEELVEQYAGEWR